MAEIISTDATQQVKRGNKKIAIAIGVVVLAALVIGGVLFFRQSQQNVKEEKKISATPTLEPTPTEKPQIDKATVKIQVQNGTGTPGQAGTTVEAIVKAGYNADNIKTANAENYDNSVTKISAKTNFEETANDLKEALKDTFDTIEIDGSPLEDSNEFDVVVITGGKIYASPTSSKPTSAPITSAVKSPMPSSTTPSPSVSPSPSPTP